jgi:UDP-N-acetylmuramoylalanine-D-glutamate ligase
MQCLECRCRQAFVHHVRVLLAGGYMKNSKFAELDTLSNKMYVQLYMFGAFVVNRVSQHIDRGYIITIRHRSLGNATMELSQQLLEPDALGRSVGDIAVFSFRARPRHCRLPLG